MVVQNLVFFGEQKKKTKKIKFWLIFRMSADLGKLGSWDGPGHPKVGSLAWSDAMNDKGCEC